MKVRSYNRRCVVYVWIARNTKEKRKGKKANQEAILKDKLR
jgi:hypothetical protein